MNGPSLTFFCELEPVPLQELFSRKEVIRQLKTLQAYVSLGLLDLSQKRASIVRQLNAENIPVTAWLLLPKEQGYWFNLENASLAINRYNEFASWSAENGLKWSGVGLDIESDIQLIQAILRERHNGLKKFLPKLLNGARVKKASADYQHLVAQIRSDGYYVESYQIPFILDERKAGSSIMQRLAGLVDLDVDREVLMLYSSFMRPFGAGLICEYGSGACGIGVGNTGGGVKMEGFQEPDYLDWAELERDLRLAYRNTPNLYIFSLEGCVQHGFMEKLKEIDWDQKAVVPWKEARKVNRVRKIAGGVLWAISHPMFLLGAGLGMLLLLRGTRRHANPA
jgi:hypothetical protein